MFLLAERRARSSGLWLTRVLSVLLLASVAFGGGCQRSQVKESTRLHAAATQAILDGNDALAIEKLTASLESEPTVGAYLSRAKLYEKTGEDNLAMADCDAGLALNPEHKDLKWLQDELQKPKSQRFKKAAPSASK